MKKECSLDEARAKAEIYCAKAERCKCEVLHKLQLWGAPMEQEENILAHLEKEGYIDELRYAKAFVRDKYRFSQWGNMKISQALRLKHIPDACIKKALLEINVDEYLSILKRLLAKKKPSVKYASDYEMKGKLIRFAAGHGYEMEDILYCLKQLEVDDEYLD